MKNKRKTEIAVGLVSALAVIILILGISFGKNWGTHSITVQMKFPNSGGIQLTSPVLVNGVKRGSVTQVKNSDGGVLIEASMDNIDDIYTDALARITILEITGGKKIEIFPGISKQKISSNTIISGKTPADIADLVAIGGDMIYDISSVVKRIDTIAYTINLALADGETIVKVKNIINNTDELTSRLNLLVSNNAKDIEQSVKSLKSLSGLLNDAIKRNDPKVSKIVDDLDNTIADLKYTLKNGNKAISSIDSLVINFRKISQDIKTGNGTVSKLLYDRELAAKLDSAVLSLGEFIKLINMYGINVNVRLGTRP